jgi:hypothetical protein
VPEIPINKDGHPTTGKNDVRLSRQTFPVRSEAKASPVKLPAKRQLDAGVLSPDPGHAVRALFFG